MTLRYSQSIIKLTKQGLKVISDYLDEGEKLANGSTYEQEEARIPRDSGIVKPNPVQIVEPPRSFLDVLNGGTPADSPPIVVQGGRP